MTRAANTREIEKALAGLIEQIAKHMGTEKSTTVSVSLHMTIDHSGGEEEEKEEEEDSWK